MSNCNTCMHQSVCHKFLFEECKHDNCSDYAEERPQGEWIYDGHNSTDLDQMFVCSVCGRRIHTTLQNLLDYPFCHCGADMRVKGGRE